MSELHRCLLRAHIREKLGITGSRARLTVVGKAVAVRPTHEETFHDASLTVVEFAQRWQEGKASLSEMEYTDVLLLGLRRLLADAGVTS